MLICVAISAEAANIDQRATSGVAQVLHSVTHAKSSTHRPTLASPPIGLRTSTRDNLIRIGALTPPHPCS